MKEKKIDKMSDEKILETIYLLLQRAQIGSKLIQDEDGVYTHQMTFVNCGDKFFASEPEPLKWPLIAMDVPKGLVN